VRGTRAAALAAIVVLVVAVIAVVAWPRRSATPVSVTVARYGTFETTLPASGTLQRPHVRILPALVPGNVERIDVTPGQRVMAGQLLMTIANPALVSAEATAHATYLAAEAHAQSASTTDPAHNQANIVQAEAALEQARFNASQARQDLAAGAESGLGYGAPSADESRSIAAANVARAQTDAREADRTLAADQDLYAQKAISRDALDHAQAQADEAHTALDRAVQARDEAAKTIVRETPVLHDRVLAAQDAVRQAQAALVAVRADAAASTAGDIAAARADADAREAEWRFDADQVARLRIVAPFAGTVQTIATESGDATRPLQPGDPVTVGMPLATIALDGAFVARFPIEEEDAARVHIGQAARVHSDDFAGRTLSGHVVALDAVARRGDTAADAARHITATVQLDQSLPYLRDGMSVDVDVLVDRLQHVVTIPPPAILRDDTGAPYVLLVRAGTARKTPIALGPMNLTSAVVRSGVAAGDAVIEPHGIALADGARVRPEAAGDPGSDNDP
jgi:RND family efflux transporter MFP subunit